MTDETLKIMQAEYQELTSLEESERKRQSLQKKKVLLEKSPKVKQYKSVLEEIKELNKILKGRKNEIRGNVLYHVLDSHVIDSSETNHIYVYVDSWGKGATTVSYDYEDTLFRRYRNIESGRLEIVKHNEFRKFHEDNTVLFAPNGMDPNEFFYQVRKTFFETAFEQGQEEAVKVIIKRYHFPTEE